MRDFFNYIWEMSAAEFGFWLVIAFVILSAPFAVLWRKMTKESNARRERFSEMHVRRRKGRKLNL